MVKMVHHQRYFARHVSVSTSFALAQRPFFSIGGGNRDESRRNKEAEKPSNGSAGRGMFPNLDEQKLQAVQDVLGKMTPEKQTELVKKALEFQKTMGKIPGFGKLMQKNLEMLEKAVGDASAPKQGPVPEKRTNAGRTLETSGRDKSKSSQGSSNVAACSARGPTIDELKKINLGPEIEELFAELSSMRAKKNTYRSKLTTAEAELQNAQNEITQLKETEASLRSKLRKAEQDILFLNSENMELKDHQKEWRKMKHKNEKLTDTVHQLQHDNAVQDRQRSGALELQLKEKDENMRSLQRKLDRLRRRDPLLQFSLLCSDIARLCNADKDTAKDAAENAFAILQSSYQEKQCASWKLAMEEDAAGAQAFMAVLRRFYISRLPYSNYDALVATDSVEGLRTAVSSAGFTLEEATAGRFVVAAPSGSAPKPFLGPYGLCMALYFAGKAEDGYSLPLKINAVYPHVSSTLFSNSERAVTQFDTARSGGPGGQAVNVSETHIIAKLSIDGEAAYVAEAQDSRSALSNREAAEDKLGNARRQHYNEQLVKQHRPEVLERELVELLQTSLNDNDRFGVEPGLVPVEVVNLVNDAVSRCLLPSTELALLHGMRHLCHKAVP
uniref:Uncharacterized protein TCIL3000_10_620 n=1 Tax=Trypanosoma congolense (strain IL3000) TaxID=1068625 RepID=G0UV88_TRYCI|nr:unnamed protein product [Trypanosoma congolense IL3000]